MYTKTSWVNRTAPYLEALNLNHMEKGIFDNSNAIDAIGLGETAKGEWTPTVGTEYPSSPALGDSYFIAGLSTPYTFTGGDLSGLETDNQDKIYYSDTGWILVEQRNIPADIVKYVDTIADLSGVDINTYTTVIVKEEGRGGTFVYDASRSGENDGGTVFYGWVRQSDYVTPEMFGAKADGTDDSAALSAAFASKFRVQGTNNTIYTVANTVTAGDNRNIYIDMLGSTIKQADGANLNTILNVGTSLENNTIVRAFVDGNKVNNVMPKLTSGSLEVGKMYQINTLSAGDDFTAVGLYKTVQFAVFIATTTTPTVWTNGSELQELSIGIKGWQLNGATQDFSLQATNCDLGIALVGNTEKSHFDVNVTYNKIGLFVGEEENGITPDENIINLYGADNEMNFITSGANQKTSSGTLVIGIEGSGTTMPSMMFIGGWYNITGEHRSVYYRAIESYDAYLNIDVLFVGSTTTDWIATFDGGGISGSFRYLTAGINGVKISNTSDCTLSINQISSASVDTFIGIQYENCTYILLPNASTIKGGGNMVSDDGKGASVFLKNSSYTIIEGRVVVGGYFIDGTSEQNTIRIQSLAKLLPVITKTSSSNVVFDCTVSTSEIPTLGGGEINHRSGFELAKNRFTGTRQYFISTGWKDFDGISLQKANGYARAEGVSIVPTSGSIVVTHGLGRTPTQQEIELTFLDGDATQNPVTAARGATTFTIAYSSGAATVDTTIKWKIR